MALNPQFGADQLWSALQLAASLNSNGTPVVDSEDKPVYANYQTYPNNFANGYNNYALDGVVAGAVNEGGNKGALSDFLITGGTPSQFAVALATFWADVALIPDTGTESITNDAMSKVSDFEAAIRASMTTEEKKPYFLHFVVNIENVVKTIIWTVTKIDTTVSMENIS